MDGSGTQLVGERVAEWPLEGDLPAFATGQGKHFGPQNDHDGLFPGGGGVWVGLRWLSF